MGKSLDELRAEAVALQGATPKPAHKKSSLKSPSPSSELQEWEKQIVEIDNRPKKVKRHQYHNAIVREITNGTPVLDIMEEYKVTTRTIKSVMKIHNQADKNK